MASNKRRYTGRVIGLAAAAALLSPHARRLVRKGVGRVVRGTRNLQEASKHVTRMGPDAPQDPSADMEDGRS